MKTIFLTSLILIMASCSSSLSASYAHKYGEKFVYEPMREIDFPDFRLKYLGSKPDRRIEGLQLGDIYEFQVSTSKISQIINWSSGTGDIGPATFEVQRKCFWLELAISAQIGKLKDNEAVVSRRDSPTECDQGDRAS